MLVNELTFLDNLPHGYSREHTTNMNTISSAVHSHGAAVVPRRRIVLLFMREKLVYM